MKSLWYSDVKMPHFERLEKDLKTDVLIIGGGITGVLCAYQLHQSGIDYVLVEADRICGGVTGNTTAKITAQHGLCYRKIADRFGLEGASLYYEANAQAIEDYRTLCEGIDCDFHASDSFVYSLNGRKELEAEQAILSKIGVKTALVDHIALPLSIHVALGMPRQAEFHPLKFLASIAHELHIYENSRVTELIGTDARTAHARITAKRIIVATHFPFLNKHGSYFLKMYQSRSYVLAIDGAEKLEANYIDADEKGLSFRTANGLLLIGCGSHRTGKKSDGWTDALRFSVQHFPKAGERFRWATQDCMTLDGLPYVGLYSAGTDGLYVATGFGKWGMTGAMMASRVLADLLKGKETPLSRLLSPSRSILRPQLAANAWETLENLLPLRHHRCPHLGCSLKWNPWEHTWDCPCHGSRFDREGRLLEGPAQGDLPHFSREK